VLILPTVAFHTLGCKVNQYESEALAEQFRQHGYQVVSFDEPADVYVINTCTVTNVSDRKSRNLIRRAAEHDDAIVVVTGCYAQTEPQEVAAIPGVDLVIGTQGRSWLADLIEEYRSKRAGAGTDASTGTGADAGTSADAASAAAPTVDATTVGVAKSEQQLQNDQSRQQQKPSQPIIAVSELSDHFEDLEAAGYAGRFAGRTRATLKIQEGCRQFCSYCKVPYARGPLRSMAKEQVIERVNALVQAGFKEIVLAGIHLGLYGCGSEATSTGSPIASPSTPSAPPMSPAPSVSYAPSTSLSELVRAIINIPGLVRLRLSSLEPMDVDEQLIEMFALPKSPLCPHVHLPLQSGDDATLKMMRRPYDTDSFRTLIARLRTANPEIAISTDLIVGFPGETEAMFQRSLAFCEEIGFSRMHVFPYSPRRGTPAATMEGQVPAPIKAERSKAVRELAAAMAAKYHQRFIARTVEVLTEEQTGNVWSGLTPHYVSARFKWSSGAPNELKKIVVSKADEKGITGTLAENRND
jgi:threonylcarbamoyladenosine tRNA methylthiotransferase MtaB